MLAALVYSLAGHAQTPSPLQEWQYSSGLILERMFEAPGPDIHAVTGVGSEVQPAYEGSRAYRVLGGPTIDVRYKDVAFISIGYIARVFGVHPADQKACSKRRRQQSHQTALNSIGRMLAVEHLSPPRGQIKTLHRVPGASESLGKT
jgi:hypothetical protein